MSHISCLQGSAEWLAARCGRITASRMPDVLATLKSGSEAAAREAYRMELVTEILTGQSAEHFTSKDMQWGTENEAFARAAYEIWLQEDGLNSVSVEPCGFFVHPVMEYAGASPDALVSSQEEGEGLLEIKCPKTSTHLRWMLAGVVPPEHRPQMQFAMACTGRSWCDFVSFDPRLPADLQLFVRRLWRDAKVITFLEEAVQRMYADVQATIEQLQAGQP
jgi:hypothetical protein